MVFNLVMEVAMVAFALTGVVGTGLAPRLTTCCEELADALPASVTFPGDMIYNDTLNTYYSQQETELQPACIVQPMSSDEVAQAVGVIYRHDVNHLADCQFAVRGGGHTPYAGAANVNGGVTIDLQDLNRVTVSNDRQTTHVGAGSRWQDVYKVLDPLKLSVAGGRVGQVGVGGLTTGGGFSFFSPKEGFVCDNVVNYELVLPNGTVVNVNSSSNPDLTIALRGGGNNFGIVTRFDFDTFQQGNLWGGNLLYPVENYPQSIQAFTNLGADPNYDANAAMYQVYVFQEGSYLISNTLMYTEDTANPAVYQPLYDIEPKIGSTLRSAPLSNFTNDPALSAQGGLRNRYVTTTWINDLDTNRNAVEWWNSSSGTLDEIDGIVYFLDLQHVLPAQTSKSSAKGGNSLGLDPNNGTLIVALLSATWSNESDDGKVCQIMDDVLMLLEVYSKGHGKYVDFKYLNYADKGQAVIKGYGDESVERLQRVSKEVDPHGIFQSESPGGFKLFP